MELNLSLNLTTWNIINNICYNGYYTTGFCTIHYYTNSNSIEFDCVSLKNVLTLDDITQIKIWFCKKNDYYLDSFYRLDFEKYIFLFKTCFFEKGIILIGNLFKKNIEFRLDLASLHQGKIMRRLRNE